MAVTNKQIMDALKENREAIRAMQGQDGNGDTVTLAVLKAQQERMEKAHDKRGETQDADHDRLGVVEGDMKVLKHRVSLFAGAQVLLVTLGSAIAAKLGMSR